MRNASYELCTVSINSAAFFFFLFRQIRFRKTPAVPISRDRLPRSSGNSHARLASDKPFVIGFFFFFYIFGLPFCRGRVRVLVFKQNRFRPVRRTRPASRVRPAGGPVRNPGAKSFSPQVDGVNFPERTAECAYVNPPRAGRRRNKSRISCLIHIKQ